MRTQPLWLYTGRTTYKWNRGIALLFLYHGTRRRWGVSVTLWPLFSPLERPGTRCTGGWVGPRAGLVRCGKSRSHRIRSPDRPARSQSLYRLSYPTNTLCTFTLFYFFHLFYGHVTMYHKYLISAPLNPYCMPFVEHHFVHPFANVSTYITFYNPKLIRRCLRSERTPYCRKKKIYLFVPRISYQRQ